MDLKQLEVENDKIANQDFRLFDIKKFLIHWARKMYDITKKRSDPKSNDPCLNFNFSFKDMNITYEEPVYKMGDIQKIPQGKSIFSTSFTNNTDSEQNYSVHVNRTTISTAEIELSSGYSKTQEIGLELKIPGDILTANVGFQREMSLETTKTQAVDHEISWGIDANVLVKPKHRMDAKATVTEEKRECCFQMKTKFQGIVRCVFTNVSKENCFIKMIEGDIGQIFENDHQIAKQMAQGVRIWVEKNASDTRIAIIETSGKVIFRYGIQQDVIVDQFKIT